jgi:hypothetical protein
MHTTGRQYTRAGSRARYPWAVLLATVAVAFSLVGSAAGASSSKKMAQLASERRVAHSIPAAGPYLVQVRHYSSEIAARIGHPLSLSLSVIVNATEVKIDGKDVLAYAESLNSSGGDSSGAPARCEIHINPSSYNSQETADFNETLAHEVFHCFEFMDFPSIEAFGMVSDRAPWLIEGEAEWVGETLQTSPNGFWSGYLLFPGVPLFTWAYSAIGFFALMTQGGEDTWHLLDPMLKAASNAAAYALAANSTLKEDWASSLARQPDLGDGWDATGPGIPDYGYAPSTRVLRNGTSLAASVKPYTNALIKFTPATDVVTITATSPYSRMHEADGKNINSLMGSTEYCAKECKKCTEMKEMPKLDPGTTWLAETGDSTGASYSVIGGPAMCGGACMIGSWKIVNQSIIPNSIGESGGAGATWVISPEGTLDINYAGSAPVQTVQGPFTVTGSGVESVKVPTDAATTGPWTATIVSEETFADGQRQGTNIGAVSTGTWSCSGDNMIVTATLGNGLPDTVLTLSRTPS